MKRRNSETIAEFASESCGRVFSDGGAVKRMQNVSGPVPQLEMVEWVVDHHEAHGHLLVHGTTLGEIVTRARSALARPVAVTPGGVRLKIVHAGWWRAA